MTSSVIVAGARTPMGRLLGSLKGFTAAELGSVAIKAALERSGVTGDQVDYVIMGQVLQAGAGQLPVRKASADAGIPMTVPSILINKVCLSGLDAIALADQLIRAGEVEIVVAGGMESMTNAPHVLPKSREGFKYGNAELVDAMAFDGLTDAFDGEPMGSSTEGYNARYSLTREEQDAFAARSHQRAAEAQKNGLFAEEIVPVEIPQRRGDPIVFSEDEGIRADTTVESLGAASPGIPQGRHDHRRFGVPDLRWSCRGRGDEQGEGGAAGPGVARRDRGARHRGWARHLAARAAVERHQEGAGPRRSLGRRPRRPGDQRGLCRGWDRLGHGHSACLKRR